MKISVGLLAYNSERWIAESAGCLQPYVDEVFVLVDSMTTDHTREILNEMKIPHKDRVWTHNYADAKNALIDNLTGDWIIILDDDEKYSPDGAKRLIDFLKNDMNDEDVHGFNVSRKHHYPFWTTNEKEYMVNIFPDPHVQIFRKGYKYQNHIHEGVNIPARNRCNLDDIYIHHHAWKGNREKYELPKHNYYKDLTEGKEFKEGEKYF